MNLKYKIF